MIKKNLTTVHFVVRIGSHLDNRFTARLNTRSFWPPQADANDAGVRLVRRCS